MKNNHERIRTRYTDREEHYEKEFQAICKKQDLNNEFINELTKAFIFPTPAKITNAKE
jgi:CRISPR-associated endonuclease Csn1